MTKQSYAHLDLGYWIEITQLQRWGNNSRRLFERSLLAIRQAYYEAEAWRQVHGSESARRLSASSKRSRSASPEPQAMQALTYQDTMPSAKATRWMDAHSWRSSPSQTSQMVLTSNHLQPKPISQGQCRQESFMSSTFVLPRQGNAAVAIRPPSNKKTAMDSNWRSGIAAA